MKILDPIRNTYALVGIKSYENHPLNLRNSFVISTMFLASVFNCVHLFYEELTFKEYAESVCGASSVLVATVLFTVLVWQIRPLYRCMDTLEEIVDKRETSPSPCFSIVL